MVDPVNAEKDRKMWDELARDWKKADDVLTEELLRLWEKFIGKPRARKGVKR